MRTLRRVLWAFLIAGGLAGCGITNPSDLIQEPVCSLNVPPGGTPATCPVFTTSKTGEFVVKITGMSPDSGATLTILYGQNQGAFCGILGQNTLGGVNRTVFDFSLAKGDYCVQAQDNGTLTRAQTVTIVISHS